MKTLSLLLIALVLFPLGANAAFYRDGLNKPVRGQYQVDSNKKSVHPRASKKRAAVVTQVSYKDPSGTFYVSHPSDWKSNPFGSAAKGFSLTPLDDGYTLKARRRSMISVSVEALPRKQDMTLKAVDGYFMSHATLSPNATISDWYIPSFNLLESADATVLGHPGKRYVYTGEQISKKYKAAEYLMSFGDALYTVRLRTEPDYFEEDLAVFEQVVSSLKLKAAASSSSSSGRNALQRRALRKMKSSSVHSTSSRSKAASSIRSR